MDAEDRNEPAGRSESALRPELLADSGIIVRTDPGEDRPEEASRVLREALSRSPLPSLSGLAFEIMGLAWVIGAAAGMACVAALVPGSRTVSAALGTFLPVWAAGEWVFWLILIAPLVAVCVRVAAGLAQMASNGGTRRKGTNVLDAFTRGRSVWMSSIGIFLQVMGMMLCATMVLLTPLGLMGTAMDSGSLGPLRVVLAGLALTFAICYGAALGALQELAMASLVRHERGTGSALLHAWRLMRSRRLLASRMALMEMGARLAIVLVAGLLSRYVGGWAGGGQLLIFGALVGGLRCHSWGIGYVAIGGLTAQGPVGSRTSRTASSGQA